MQQQQIHCTKITTVQNEHLFMNIQSFLLQFLNDQITVSFVRAAGVLAKGRMFDMPGLDPSLGHQCARERRNYY